MKKHVLDKLIIRELFWFIVLPYRFKVWQEENKKKVPL